MEGTLSDLIYLCTHKSVLFFEFLWKRSCFGICWVLGKVCLLFPHVALRNRPFQEDL